MDFKDGFRREMCWWVSSLLAVKGVGCDLFNRVSRFSIFVCGC